MDRIKGARPSPAIVIAVVALVAALAGTAIAGPAATTSISRQQTKNVAKGQTDKSHTKAQTVSQQITLNANNPQQVTVPCPGKTRLVGGGAKFDQAPVNTNNLEIQASYPMDQSWTAIARTNQNNRPFTVYARCVALRKG